MDKYNIYVGMDFSNDGQLLANEICRRSILKNCKTPEKLNIINLVKKDYEEQKIFWREHDPKASTDFTYTRFLVPYLNNYEGLAIFCDSDFLWECDILELIKNFDNTKAVMCVKHDYITKFTTKMNGLNQEHYPRKNWSSLIVFNCSHPSIKNLSLDAVNTQSPTWLHRMQWLQNDEIGEINKTYNYLVGEYNDIDNPNVIHYTDGGPWHNTFELNSEWDKKLGNQSFIYKWLTYINNDEYIRLEKELNRQKKN